MLHTCSRYCGKRASLLAPTAHTTSFPSPLYTWGRAMECSVLLVVVVSLTFLLLTDEIFSTHTEEKKPSMHFLR